MQLCFLHCWRYINDLCLTFLPMTWEKQKKQNKNTFRHLRRLNFIFFPNPPHLLWYEKIAGKNNEIVGRKKNRFFDNILCIVQSSKIQRICCGEKRMEGKTTMRSREKFSQTDISAINISLLTTMASHIICIYENGVH